MEIKRRKSRVVKIGGINIGGDNPISIQSMTKTDTADFAGTLKQINRLERAGCEIVRVAVKDQRQAKAIKKIRPKVRIPLVADVHFHYSLAIRAIKNGADGIRLNPGNIYRPQEIAEVVRVAKKYKTPIRVGVNSGSLNLVGQSASQKRQTGRPTDRQTIASEMVESASRYIKLLEDLDFGDIIVSLKSSDVLSTIQAYRQMARLCDYPFHLGVTACGLPEDGIIKSAIGVGFLLAEGIGDTLRVSLTAHPVKEVEAAKRILESLQLRAFGLEIISCPTCGRCEVNLVKIVKEVKRRLNCTPLTVNYKQPPKVAIMGCVVNGPGESKDADIGVALGRGCGVLFKRGKVAGKLKEKEIVEVLLKEIRGFKS